MDFTDLVMYVKLLVPGRSDPEILFALRRAYINFMTIGKFEVEDISLDLVKDQYSYKIDTSGNTYIQSISNQNRDGFEFDGIDTITFELADFEDDAKFTCEAILGYKFNTTSFNDMTFLVRYYEGIVNGACAMLDLDNKRMFNRNFHNALSEAMMDSSTFTGVEG